MKLSDFKVGDLVLGKKSRHIFEVKFIGESISVIADDFSGEECWHCSTSDDWELAPEPKREGVARMTEIRMKGSLDELTRDELIVELRAAREVVLQARSYAKGWHVGLEHAIAEYDKIIENAK